MFKKFLMASVFAVLPLLPAHALSVTPGPNSVYLGPGCSYLWLPNYGQWFSYRAGTMAAGDLAANAQRVSSWDNTLQFVKAFNMSVPPASQITIAIVVSGYDLVCQNGGIITAIIY